MSTTETILDNAFNLPGQLAGAETPDRSGPVWLGGHHPSALNENRLASLQRRYSDVEGALPGCRSARGALAQRMRRKLLKGRYTLFNQEGVPDFHAFNS